jgi:uncharacterized protein (DUF342 family)
MSNSVNPGSNYIPKTQKENALYKPIMNEQQYTQLIQAVERISKLEYDISKLENNISKLGNKKQDKDKLQNEKTSLEQEKTSLEQEKTSLEQILNNGIILFGDNSK